MNRLIRILLIHYKYLYVYLYNYPDLNIFLTLGINNLFSVAPFFGFYSLVSTTKGEHRYY